ncbi:hypothetical protein FACS1894122_03870 [Alphaproteobacteria bacterium]|nr:hypothetical protein FACS1894122_03870 [Alphaproteobacteria bacterium]
MSKIICALKGAICVLSMVTVTLLSAMQDDSRQLFEAIRKSEVALVKTILERNDPAKNKEIVNAIPECEINTPLSLAISSKNFSKEIFELLIDNGADLEARGRPIMMYTPGRGQEVWGYSPERPLQEAIKKGNIEAINVLLDRGATLTNHCSDRGCWNALRGAASSVVYLPMEKTIEIINLLLDKDPTLCDIGYNDGFETITPARLVENLADTNSRYSCSADKATTRLLYIAAYLKSWKEQH